MEFLVKTKERREKGREGDRLVCWVFSLDQWIFNYLHNTKITPTEETERASPWSIHNLIIRHLPGTQSQSQVPTSKEVESGSWFDVSYLSGECTWLLAVYPGRDLFLSCFRKTFESSRLYPDTEWTQKPNLRFLFFCRTFFFTFPANSSNSRSQLHMEKAVSLSGVLLPGETGYTSIFPWVSQVSMDHKTGSCIAGKTQNTQITDLVSTKFPRVKAWGL